MRSNVRQELERTTPESYGIASAAVLQFFEAVEHQIHELHSVMILRHGCVVAEGWWSPYQADDLHSLFSVSKSFTSTAVGLAISEGHFSIDDPVISFFPDEMSAETSDFLKALRIRHLLTMTTGHTDDTLAYMLDRPDGNWLKGFFETPIRHAPGTHFVYNTGATYILSAIVQKTTGLTLIDYLTPRLFEPLGIEKATWEESPQGINVGGYGLSIKTEDMARFGQLYLQKGLWQGKQVIPASWVEEAAASQVSNGDGRQSDWTQGYGYQFWRCRHNAYRGDGVFGQYCIIMPEQDVVIAITGGTDVFDAQQPLDLIWEILLPAMQSQPLPEDASAHTALTEKLSSLIVTPVQGQSTSSIASQISGRTYRFDANELKLEALILSFTEGGCTVSVKRADRDETIPCGDGAWQRGETSLLNEPGVVEVMKTASSGAWTAAETFTMVVRLYETPFYHTLTFHFADDEIMLESRINALLGALNTLLLTGHAE